MALREDFIVQIGALLPLSGILALIAGRPRPTGIAQEPATRAESPPHPATPVQPLASVQMLVTLAAMDPSRERPRAKRGTAHSVQPGAEEASVAPDEALNHFVLPVECIGQSRRADDPLADGNTQPTEARVRRPASKLDIEV